MYARRTDVSVPGLDRALVQRGNVVERGKIAHHLDPRILAPRRLPSRMRRLIPRHLVPRRRLRCPRPTAEPDQRPIPRVPHRPRRRRRGRRRRTSLEKRLDVILEMVERGEHGRLVVLGLLQMCRQARRLLECEANLLRVPQADGARKEVRRLADIAGWCRRVGRRLGIRCDDAQRIAALRALEAVACTSA